MGRGVEQGVGRGVVAECGAWSRKRVVWGRGLLAGCGAGVAGCGAWSSRVWAWS